MPLYKDQIKQIFKRRECKNIYLFLPLHTGAALSYLPLGKHVNCFDPMSLNFLDMHAYSITVPTTVELFDKNISLFSISGGSGQRMAETKFTQINTHGNSTVIFLSLPVNKE